MIGKLHPRKLRAQHLKQLGLLQMSFLFRVNSALQGANLLSFWRVNVWVDIDININIYIQYIYILCTYMYDNIYIYMIYIIYLYIIYYKFMTCLPTGLSQMAPRTQSPHFFDIIFFALEWNNIKAAFSRCAVKYDGVFGWFMKISVMFWDPNAIREKKTHTKSGVRRFQSWASNLQHAFKQLTSLQFRRMATPQRSCDLLKRITFVGFQLFSSGCLMTFFLVAQLPKA